MSISSAIAVTITLIIISLFLIFSYHLRTFTKNIEASMQISVMIGFDYESEAEEKRIQDEIKAIDGVAKITYHSKQEEYEYYISMFDDNPETKAVFEPFQGDQNPFHDAIYIEATSGDKINDIAAAIKNVKGVDEVSYGGQSTVDLIGAMTDVRSFGGIFVLALSILAVFLIQNTIKLTIYAREDEITIMKNVGATNHFIRAPFVWEGIITGVLGALIPIALTIYGYFFVYQKTGGILFSSMFRLAPPNPFVFYLSGILLMIGVVVGFIGSWLSVTRYLRLTR
jgi:cell division transport system permease protein